MKILLTGASGYLGQHLLYRLVVDPPVSNLHVYAQYRSNDSFCWALDETLRESSTTVEPLQLDLTDSAAVGAWFQSNSVDTVIHTAAMSSPRDCQADPVRARIVNVAEALWQALPASKTRVIALSTDQVYSGDQPPYRETDAVGPCNVYAESKVAMEAALLALHPSAVVLRSSIILGPKAPLASAHETFLHFIASREDQSTVFWTDERRSVISVSNVVDTIIFFLQPAAPGGVHNLGGPQGVSRMDMASAVFAHLDYDSAVLQAQERATQPASPVASPLDISMVVDKLCSTTGLSLQSLSEIVVDTFRQE